MGAAVAEVDSGAARASTRYWDRIVEAWNQRHADTVWRAHSDAVNSRLLARWLPAGPIRRVLKTDLFDEAVSEGVYPILQDRSGSVMGIDISPKVVDAACARYPRLSALPADVSLLPFKEGEFDAIVSISTLDHFDSRDQISAALGQLYRVLKPGGTLIVTLDNGSNPIVAFRNLLPYPLLRSLHMVPYRMGATCTAKGFLGLLRSYSFEIRDVAYTIHCPRLAAAISSRMVQQFGSAESSASFLRGLDKLEELDQLPTRSLTGHYIAALAKKR